MKTTYSTLNRLIEEPDKETCPPEKDLWFWVADETMWSITPPEGTTIDDWEILPHNGLVPISNNGKHGPLHLLVSLQSQLILSILYGSTCMTAAENITNITKAPVVLGSLQAFPKMTTRTRHPYPYPPKEHGTTALVLDKKDYRYYLKDLPLEAQNRQKEISQLIEDIQSMPQEENFNAFTDSPEELRIMLQQLAKDYYQYHQLLQTKNSLPRAINPFESGIALASTCTPMQLFTYATQNAMAGATRWIKPKDHRPHFSHNGNIIEYGESDIVITDEVATSLWEQVKQQNYTVVDMATFAISLCARSLEPDHSAWVYASEFIKSRGLAKMKKAVTDTIDREAGHQQKNQKEAQQSIFHLEKLWMTINQEIDEQEYNPKTKKRKRRKFTYKGRFLVVKGVLTQKDLGTTDSETSMEVAWHIAPGDWLAPFLQYPNRQIANLSDRVLQYNPRTQKWEKSFGYYFFFNGHMNSKGRGCTFNRYIEPLLKECSLDEEIERNRPQRTRDRFEKAMNKLVEDRLINEWHYTDHKSGYIPSKRSWIDEWLGLKITIEIAPEKGLLP